MPESHALPTCPSEPPAGGDFGWALATLLRAYLKQVGEVVAELPGGPRAYQVLTTAATGVCQNQAAMAERLGIDRTIMTYLLDGLEAQQLVKRTPDPADRRGRHITLTPKGSALLAELVERVAQVERRLLSHLPDRDAAHLRAMLSVAAQHADGAANGETTCQIVESTDTSACPPGVADGLHH